MIPEAFLQAYAAARHRAGLIDRAGLGRIVVSGRDRASYLQGLLTNDIVALKPGQGCYAAYLTPQGRMITDLWVYELGDVILITLGLDQKDTLLAKLDQFIFSEDVQLGDVTGTFSSLAIVGPDAARIVGVALAVAPESDLVLLGEHGNRRALFGGRPAIILRVTDTGEPGYEILVDFSQRSALEMALHGLGAVDLDAAVAEALRIEGGIPKFHRDMNEETIPLEAGLESRAISLTKGCYVGQEVIIRVLHRGHGRVARKLIGLTLEGDSGGPSGSGDGIPPNADHVPADDASVTTVDGREVGRTTSGSFSPALRRPIALAYLHRDFIEPGTRVVVNGVAAAVTALPFVERPS